MGRRSVNTPQSNAAKAPHNAAKKPRCPIPILPQIKQALHDLAPMGRDLTQDFALYGVGLFLAWFVSVGFWVDLQNTLVSLTYVQVLAGQSLAMPSFAALLGNYMLGFPVLAALCLELIPLYYQMHYGESRSVYLMRRLPQRGALHRRCLALPLCMAGLTLAIGAALLAFYYHQYCKLTPAELLQSGQLALLWETWFW